MQSKRTLTDRTPRDSEGQGLLQTNHVSYSSIGSDLQRTTSFIQGRKVSFVASVFNLSNAILGAGILGLPYTCSKCGIVLFSLLLVAIAAVADYSLFLLLWCCRTINRFSYEELGAFAFGTKGPYLVGAAILLQNLGQMVSYLVVVGDLLPQLMKQVVGASHHDSDITHRKLLMIIVLVVVVLPISLLRRLSFMSFATGFSFFSMILFAIVVFVRYLTIDDLGNNLEPISLAMVSTSTSVALPTMCFSFVCHTTVLPVFTELEEGDRLARTPRYRGRMRQIARISILFALVLYLTASDFGYLTFHNTLQKDILKSYMDWNEQDALTLAIRICFTISVTFTIPGSCFPFRKTILILLYHTSEYEPKRHVGVTLATLALVLVLALFVPAITTVFGLVGATSSVSLVFLLPSAIFLKLKGLGNPHPIHTVLCSIMFVVGVLIGLISLGGMIAEWVQDGFGN